MGGSNENVLELDSDGCIPLRVYYKLLDYTLWMCELNGMWIISQFKKLYEEKMQVSMEWQTADQLLPGARSRGVNYKRV